MFKYSKQYSGEDPIFEEGDIFKTIVPLNDTYSYDINIDGESNNNGNGTRNGLSNDNVDAIIIKLIQENNRITRNEIAEVVGISVRSVTRKLNEIPNVKYVGKGKNGHWVVS